MIRLAKIISVVLLFLVVAPIVWIIIRAVGGYENLLSAFASKGIWIAALRSLLLVAGVTAATLAISLPLAWLTHATNMPGRKLFRRLVVLPLVIPSYVSGFVVVATFGPTGLAAQLHLPFPDVYGYFGAWASLLFVYPYVLLPIQAALVNVDPRRWEAARSLGAAPLKAFKDVVWPEIRPATMRGASIVALYVLGDFGAVSLTRYPALSFLIYQRYSSPFRRHEAIAYGLILILLAGLFLFFFHRVGKQSLKGSRGQTAVPWPTLDLGRWKWGATTFTSIILFLGAIGPMLVIGWWFIRGLILGQTMINLSTELQNSFFLAGVGSLLITILAVGPALTLRFTSGPIAKWLDQGLFLGFALPGVVIGLALVSLASQYAFPIYQTVYLLQIAYTIRFISHATSTVSAQIAGQNPNLYDASRSLGRSQFQTLKSVVFPLALPAIGAAILAVFISIIKELPATLILKPPGFSTLSYRIWSLTQDAYFAATSVTLFVLISISLIPILLRKDSDPTSR